MISDDSLEAMERRINEMIDEAYNEALNLIDTKKRLRHLKGAEKKMVREDLEERELIQVQRHEQIKELEKLYLIKKKLFGKTKKDKGGGSMVSPTEAIANAKLKPSTLGNIVHNGGN